jgi:hypothetical protein
MSAWTSLVFCSKEWMIYVLYTIKKGVSHIQFFVLTQRRNRQEFRDSTLSTYNKLTLYKLMIRPILIYAGPVWSNTSQSNYRRLQILQSKCLRVIGDYPRRTPIPYLHSTLSLEFIYTFIYRLTENFFQKCTTHPNPLISQIGNYSLPDLLAQYTKYTHKRTKHLLL